MAKKKKPKSSGVTRDDVIVGLLIAFASGAAVFFFALAGGAFLSGRQETAEQPNATQTARGTLPSSAPISTAPAQEATEPQNKSPQQTDAPATTQTQSPATSQVPAQTQTPTAPPDARPSNTPTQNTGPVVSISPTVPPTQPSGQGGNGNSGNYYHDFSGGKLLGSKESDKYHNKDCMGAQKIPPENEIWFSSVGEAEASSYKPCGICYR